ncbi:hypothetical protein BT96DRAFT_138503 [Gymnopus androsaceus JB14]|uniref:Uncharacterized protein n=1 Tax=Gymnopus androsaceus JB14 TaxID=1447944 RepID=A0A6A4HFF1_9AGAR|nr:hypothetical protein BT96DRAFT_138503 [Gymnopus androsaceus JB14]
MCSAHCSMSSASPPYSLLSLAHGIALSILDSLWSPSVGTYLWMSFPASPSVLEASPLLLAHPLLFPSNTTSPLHPTRVIFTALDPMMCCCI